MLTSPTFLGILFTLVYVSGNFREDFECPFPEGQQGQSQTTCENYLACEWTSDRCHMKSNSDAGLKVVSNNADFQNGFSVNLQPSNASNYMFQPPITNLRLDVIYHSETHLQLKIVDADTARYEVPLQLTLPETANLTDPANYQVTVRGPNDMLLINVTRSNGNTIFYNQGALTFEDQFIQFRTRLASTYMYGFGENNHDTFKHQFDPRVTQPIFARDQNMFYPNVNSYGVHPYHMVMEDDEGNAHSVLLVNSNAMEYSTFMMHDDNISLPVLTYRTIGGIIDLHIFMGPSPENLNQQYMTVIGYPTIPPYTALGFHLSRWGYTSTDEVRNITDRMRSLMIPQDVQTFDIDYMDGRRDFTVDPNNWSDLNVLISELHANDISSTVILDPAIAIDFDSYNAAQTGLAADAYIHWANSSYVPPTQPINASDYVVGNVWPASPTVFPDFLNTATQDWWISEIVILQNNLGFDYLWIDMNEPANFDTDQADKLQCPNTQWDDPPYPTSAVRGPDVVSGRISDKTICMSSTQNLDGTAHSHYNVHSLYGWSQAEPSHRAMDMARPDTRPFVLSRSSYPGSGQYAKHWLGDNFSTWEQMRKSIIGMFEFNMFGMPFTGADICGFGDDTTEELCTRWTQLGAFYPFCRNHNSINSIDQDPTQWPSVTAAAKKYYGLRYQYVPFLYTLLHKTEERGDSVVRPLLNVFPSDVASRDIDDQFLWGDGIMVAPILVEGATSRNVYFPQSKWYNLELGNLVSSGNEMQEVTALLDTIPVYARGGVILPWQEPSLTLTESRLNNFGLTVPIDENDFAVGQIFWDDGVRVVNNPLIQAYGAKITYSMNNLTLEVQHGRGLVNDITMNSVYFYGYFKTVTSVLVNGDTVALYFHDVDAGILSLDFDVPLREDMVINIFN